MLFQVPAPRSSHAYAAESPVRSSELLGVGPSTAPIGLEPQVRAEVLEPGIAEEDYYRRSAKFAPQ